MNKRLKTSIVLNALVFAGMLLFASQAADAASNQPPSADSPTAKAPSSTNGQNPPAVTDDTTPDTMDRHEMDNTDVIGDIGNQDIQDIETVDVGEIELPELETPDSN